jgi:secreted PhoX family phosphatase
VAFLVPDNLAFDDKNNLWFTSDIAAGSQKKKQYEPFKNNGLFMVPVSGKNAGKVLQIASAPNAAEFTGPFFSPDYKTLFLSVQHPGKHLKIKITSLVIGLMATIASPSLV